MKNFYYLRALALLIFGSSFFSLQNISAAFTDVGEKQNFRDAILYAQEEGIIKDYGDGTFQPDRKNNRGEMVEIIWRTLEDVQNEDFSEYENGDFFIQNATDDENFNNNGAGYDDDGSGPICTAEAKSCGDGTFVGRTGPNCEFAKCPG
ncbi:MAG TPA: S-layer homology domain-containing protein, partial [Desulfocapsa sulfexigens]|nr:S-layer homology domain-containing protein [Desulfocapsa sulfexigens]